ncbi:MAG: molybdopterin-synthase adenylyltransferase MoeB [Verrucomicrobiota bacterium]|nr:molybdopterin-synthase adenylyltransferase MoeB [Verrucomicrobiota bacterium]
MNEELRRYERHVILPGVGVEGQNRIRRSHVLCVGAGGLGSAVAMHLAAAGVGVLGVVDDDRVDLTNLPRQLLHGTPDIGRLKAESARDTLRRLNPDVEVECHVVWLDSENVLDIVGRYDLVVDCSDNMQTRYVVNEACVRLRKPNIYGAVFQFEGQVSVLAPHMGGPCYRCMYPEPPGGGRAPSSAPFGVLSTVPGIIGNIQATEAMKAIAGFGDLLIGRLLVLDVLRMQFHELKTRRDTSCPTCGIKRG